MVKIYSCPDECPCPTFDDYDYSAKPGDPRHWQTLEAHHAKQLKEQLIRMGYTGKNTGEIVQYGVADGCAQYMVMEKGSTFGLIHLTYGDAYHYMGLEHFPKKAILDQIKSQKKADELFGRKEAIPA